MLRRDRLHLSADVEKIVLDVLKHVDLRDDEFPQAVCLYSNNLQAKLLKRLEGRDNLAELKYLYLLYSVAKLLNESKEPKYLCS